MENWWAIVGTIIGALVTGVVVLLNSIYTTRAALKRENRNRLFDEQERDILQLETLYQELLHLLDKLIRNLGSLSADELEEYYRLEVKLELISTKIIVEQVSFLRIGISEMVEKLPKMPEEFIPKFEEDHERRSRLEKRKNVKVERSEKAQAYIGKLNVKLSDLSKTMKEDLQNRRLLDINSYIDYRKKN